jgi:hypothetical protein
MLEYTYIEGGILIVYYEKLLLIDFSISYILIYLICRFFSIKVNKKRIILLLIFNVINIILFIKMEENYKYIELLFPFSNTIFLFWKEKIFLRLKISFLFIFEYFILGGFNIIILSYIKNYYLTLIIILILFILFFEYVLNVRIKEIPLDTLYYDIKINDIFLKAFLDTGNLVFDDYNDLPIIFINDKYKINYLKKVSKINVSSIGNNKRNIDLFETNEIYIKINNHFIKKDCLIGFIEIEFDSIIGINMIR